MERKFNIAFDEVVKLREYKAEVERLAKNDSLWHNAVRLDNIRSKQYYSLLSVENVCFDDKEFNDSYSRYKLCCELLGEKEGDKSLDELKEIMDDK